MLESKVATKRTAIAALISAFAALVLALTLGAETAQARWGENEGEVQTWNKDATVLILETDGKSGETFVYDIDIMYVPTTGGETWYDAKAFAYKRQTYDGTNWVDVGMSWTNVNGNKAQVTLPDGQRLVICELTMQDSSHGSQINPVNITTRMFVDEVSRPAYYAKITKADFKLTSSGGPSNDDLHGGVIKATHKPYYQVPDGTGTQSDPVLNWRGLQEAITKAKSGDTIYIKGNLTAQDTGYTPVKDSAVVSGKNITLVAAPGADVTINRKSGDQDFSMFQVREGGGLTIGNGITLTGKTKTENACASVPRAGVDSDQACDTANAQCTEPVTSAQFTGGKGFFIDIENGSATLTSGATLADFITDGSVENTAPVYAKGANSTFNMTGGRIEHNSVGYSITGADAASNLRADQIANKLKGEYARTYTAGGVIYAGGATGDLSGGTISGNRGDTGAVVVRGDEPTKRADNSYEATSPYGSNVPASPERPEQVTISGEFNAGNNYGVHFGGAFYIYNGGSVEMLGGSLTNNFCWNKGGAVFVNSEIYDSTQWMVDESTQYVEPAYFLLQGGVISGNTAVQRGGAIEVASNDVVLASGSIENNYCRELGGAIYVEGDGIKRMYQLVIPEGCITGNSAVLDVLGSGNSDDEMDRRLNDSMGCGFSNDRSSAGIITRFNTSDKVDYYGHEGNGGGLWLCAFGGNATFDVRSFDKVNIYGNTSEANPASNDIYLSATRPNAGSAINVLGTSNKVKFIDQYGREIKGKENGDAVVYTGVLRLENQAKLSESEKTCDGGVTIKGNVARNGGAIAANGTVVFGSKSEVYRFTTALDMTKLWSNRIKKAKEEQPIVLTFKAEVDGEVIDLGYSVTLDGEADEDVPDTAITWEKEPWKAYFGLPMTVTKADGSVYPLFKFKDKDTGVEYDPANGKDLKALFELLGTNSKNNADKFELTEWKLIVEETVADGSENTYEFTAGAIKLSDLRKEPGEKHEYKDKSGAVVGEVVTHAMVSSLEQTISNDRQTEFTEKYVNSKVHQDLSAFDEEFTYTVMGYVPKGATSATITDRIADSLEFVKSTHADDKKQYDLESVYVLRSNNHKGDGESGTVANPENSEDYLFTAKWVAKNQNDKCSVDVSGQTISVTFSQAYIDGVFNNSEYKNADGTDLDGFWVMVSYKAKYKESYYDLEEVQKGDNGWVDNESDKQAPYGEGAWSELYTALEAEGNSIVEARVATVGNTNHTTSSYFVKTAQEGVYYQRLLKGDGNWYKTTLDGYRIGLVSLDGYVVGYDEKDQSGAQLDGYNNVAGAFGDKGNTSKVPDPRGTVLDINKQLKIGTNWPVTDGAVTETNAKGQTEQHEGTANQATFTVETGHSGTHSYETNVVTVKPVVEDLKVAKKWEDTTSYPSDAEFVSSLLVYKKTGDADGVLVANAPTPTVTKQANGDWVVEWKDLPKLQNTIYYVKEGQLTGFQPATYGADKTEPYAVNDGIINNKPKDEGTPEGKVTVNKVDEAGEAISGATLVIQRDGENGREEVVTPWETDGTAKEFTLEPGTYYLVELAAPNGYKLADEIEFVVTAGTATTTTGKYYGRQESARNGVLNGGYPLVVWDGSSDDSKMLAYCINPSRFQTGIDDNIVGAEYTVVTDNQLTSYEGLFDGNVSDDEAKARINKIKRVVLAGYPNNAADGDMYKNLTWINAENGNKKVTFENASWGKVGFYDVTQLVIHDIASGKTKGASKPASNESYGPLAEAYDALWEIAQGSSYTNRDNTFSLDVSDAALANLHLQIFKWVVDTGDIPNKQYQNLISTELASSVEVSMANVPEEAKVEKYINHKVHEDLSAFDKVFEYSVMAYVPGGSTEVVITDTLSDSLMFVDATGRPQYVMDGDNLKLNPNFGAKDEAKGYPQTYLMNPAYNGYQLVWEKNVSPTAHRGDTTSDVKVHSTDSALVGAGAAASNATHWQNNPDQLLTNVLKKEGAVTVDGQAITVTVDEENLPASRYGQWITMSFNVAYKPTYYSMEKMQDADSGWVDTDSNKQGTPAQTTLPLAELTEKYGEDAVTVARENDKAYFAKVGDDVFQKVKGGDGKWYLLTKSGSMTKFTAVDGSFEADGAKVPEADSSGTRFDGGLYHTQAIVDAEKAPNGCSDVSRTIAIATPSTPTGVNWPLTNGTDTNSDEQHEGTANQASYSVTGSHGATSTAKTNVVTVKPVVEQVEVEKIWKNINDEEMKLGETKVWPTGADGQPVEITFNLVKIVKGNPATTTVIDTHVATSIETAKHTFTDLPVLEGVSYEVIESIKKGAFEGGTDADPSIVITPASADAPKTTAYTFTNVDRPKVEKYVNSQVHVDLANADEEFEYTILAYMPADAIRLVISDTLVDALEFVKVGKYGDAAGAKAGTDRVVADKDIRVLKSNDHVGDGSTGTAATTPDTATGNVVLVAEDVANGTREAGYDIEVNGKTITVTLEEALLNDIRSEGGINDGWIFVKYKAKITEEYYESLQKLIESDSWIDDVEPKAGDSPIVDVTERNWPVLDGAVVHRSDLGGIEQHEGVKNQASYEVTFNNSSTVDYDTNIVTVKPPEEKFRAEKAWKDAKGNDTTVWPTDADNNPIEVAFKLYRINKADNTEVEVASASTTSFGEVKFTDDDGKELTFVKLNGYSYEVREDVAAPYKQDGKATSTSTEGEVNVTKTTFTNRYEREDATAELVFLKTLGGYKDPALEDGQFSFTITGSEGAPMPTTTTVTNQGGKVTFGPITFTDEGTYTYTVSEVQSDNTIKYPGNLTAVVKVTDDKNGKLVAEVTYPNGEDGAEYNTFENEKITPGETTAAIEVAKSLVKAEDNKPAEYGSRTFSFELVAGTNDADVDTPMPANSTVTVNEDGTVSFGDITFAKTGVYNYTIKEVVPSPADQTVVYDLKVVDVVVTVVDAADNKLAATVTYDGANAVAAFTNKVVAPVKGQPVFDKKYIDLYDDKEIALKGGEFSFVLTDSEGNEVEKVSNDAAGKVTFSEITFTEPGEYTYTVNEVAGNDDTIAYTSETKTVTFKVERVNDELQVTTTYNPESRTFTNNKKNPGDTTAELEASKVFNANGNSTASLGAGDFSFKLEAVDGAPMPANATDGSIVVTNDAAGKVAFGTITYDTAGKYSYTITEVVPNPADATIKYDGATHTAVVEVVRTADNTLEATVVYDGDEAASAPVFTNEKAEPTEAKLAFSKEYTGYGVEPLTGGEFSFQISAEDGTPLPESAVAENDADGNVAFGPIKFEQPGTYTYTVAEVTDGLDSMISTPADKTVVIEVTAENGVLTAEVTYEDGTEFVNTRNEPGETSAIIKVAKDFNNADGSAATYGEEVFTFQLTAKDGAPTPADGNTVQVTKDGETSFGSITFTKVGEYHYTIEEIAGKNPSIVYDGKKANVTITVADGTGDDYGNLVATVAYDGNKVPVFVNTKKVDVQITKVWSDGTVADGNAVAPVEQNTFKTWLTLIAVVADAAEQNVTDQYGSDAHLSIETAADGSYIVKWINLAPFDEAGNAITYLVKENQLAADAGYKGTYSNADDSDAEGAVTDGGTITNVKPALEKFIKEKVDLTIDNFNDPYEFEIMAYVTKDATKLTVTDPLNDWIKFADPANVQVADMGTVNNHEEDGTVAGSGTAITDAAISTDNNTLTVVVDNVEGKGLRNHWVKVSFNAQFDEGKYAELLAKITAEQKTADGNWAIVDEDGTVVVKVSEKPHDGVPNKASYTVDTTNGGTHECDSNTVTVEPKTTEVKVSKSWLKGGEAISWPEGAVVTVSLTAGDADLAKLLPEGYATSVELNAGQQEYTFAKLPKVSTIAYGVKESGFDTGNDLWTSGTVVDEGNGVFTIKNVSDKKTIHISKQDMGAREIPGAQIAIYEGTLTEVPAGAKAYDSWTSTTAAHTVELLPGDYTLVEVNAPEGFKPIETIIHFHVSANGNVTVTNTEEIVGGEVVAKGTTLTLKDEAKPGETEKYVEKDVQYHLANFDTVYTYDILAYVPGDAVSVTITDQLVSSLEFVPAGADDETGANVKVAVKSDNNHEVNGTVATDGQAIDYATITTNGRDLAVVIDNIGYKDGEHNLGGKWIQVSFDAKITAEAYEKVAAKVASGNLNGEDSGISWKLVEGNGNVKGGVDEHAGITNKGAYTVTASNEGTSTYETNEVTVEPELTKVSADKTWKVNGVAIEWPKNATVTVALSEDGKTPISAERAAKLGIAADYALTGTLASATDVVTFENLPKFSDVVYSVVETAITGADGFELDTITGPVEGTYTIVNKKGETPESEKYVKNTVTYDYTNFDETFEYEVLAYITNDGKALTITDALNGALEFVPAGADDKTGANIHVYDMGEGKDANNHVDFVAGAGKEITPTTAGVSGQDLTVTIDDVEAAGLRNHWVKVTFDARITAEAYAEVAAKIAEKAANGTAQDGTSWENVGTNGRVKIDIKNHDGVPNKATYTLTSENEGEPYIEPTNTVTVEPKTTKVEVSKSWLVGKDNVVADWPEGASVNVALTAINAAGEDVLASTNIAEADAKAVLSESQQSYTFDKLPCLEGVTYGVAESDFATPGTDIWTNGDVEGSNGVFTITNRSDEQTIKVKKTDMGSKEVEGATIKITTADGKVVDQWVSGTDDHEVTLLPGDYKLEEVKAPAGFEAIETTIEFHVDANGNVKVTTTTEIVGGDVVAEGDTLTLQDQPKGPQVEKYVNKDVHADLREFDREFTYDVLAYVPGDAVSIVITDPLSADLVFVDDADAIAGTATVVASTENDHKATTVEPTGETVQTVLASGEPIAATGAITEANGVQTLTVTVPDAKAAHGKWVRITFTAKIKDTIRTLDGLTTATITDDEPVQSGLDGEEGHKAGNHSGVVNQAHYRINIDNEGNSKPGYEDIPTNEVTVIPETTELTVEKQWLVNGKAADKWPEGAEVDVTLVATNAAGEDVTKSTKVDPVTVTLDADKQSYTFANLPKLVDVTYSVVEGEVRGADNFFAGSAAYNEEAEKWVIANTQGDVELKISKEDLGGHEVAGAGMKLTGENLEAAIEWTSATEPHSLKLLPGTYTLEETVAPAGFEKVETTITFTLDKNGKVEIISAVEKYGEGEDAIEVAAVVDGVLVLRDAPKPAETEKYVQKDVQYHLANFDQTFTYDILAYVPGDATEVEISDTLASSLEFARAEGQTDEQLAAAIAATAVAKDSNNHNVGEEGTVAQASEAKVDATATISGNTLTVTVSNIGQGEDQQNLAGKWIQVTFDAKITATAYAQVAEKVATGDVETPVPGISWEYVDDNKTVNSDEEHGGISNDAHYKVTAVNESNIDTNTVTIEPETTKVDVVKVWKLNGTSTDWPEGAEVDVKVVSITGEGDDAVVADVAGKTATLTDAQKSAEFVGLPKVSNVRYAVEEVEVRGVDNTWTLGGVEHAVSAEGEELEDSFVITNVKDDKDIQISKTDLNGTAVPNAQLAIYAGALETVTDDDEPVKSWTSGTEPETFSLTPGTYTLVEVVAPAGFEQVTTTVVFTVDANGKVETKTATVEGGEVAVEDGVLVLKDTPLRPEVEKYVNDDVHADIEEFNRIFEYDVLAFVPGDAKSITITDTLNANLHFVDEASVIASTAQVVASNAATDHVAATGTVVAAAEAPIAATATIAEADGVQTLTVNVADATAAHGKWIRVTFKAQINDDLLKLADLDTKNITVDDPVKSALAGDDEHKAGNHTGIPNKASYTIDAGHENDSRPGYSPDKPLETNEVTVIPAAKSVTVNKAWEGDEVADRPDESTFRSWLQLIAMTAAGDIVDIAGLNTSAVDNDDVEIVSEGDTWKVQWKNLPKLLADAVDTVKGQIIYAIKEVIPAADKADYDYDATYNNGNATAGESTDTPRDADVAFDGGTIVNTKVAPTAITIEATKVLENRDLEDGKYQIALFESNERFEVADGATPVATATNEDAKFSFSIDYTAAGTHYYVLRELNTGDSTVAYDTAERHITVEVAHHATESRYVATVTGIDAVEGEENTYTAGTFTNTYEVPDAEPTGLELEAEKKVLDINGNDVTSDYVGQFQFMLTVEGPEGYTAEQVATNSLEDGTKASFTLDGLTQPGIYTYKIVELVGNDEAIAYNTGKLVDEGSFAVQAYVVKEAFVADDDDEANANANAADVADPFTDDNAVAENETATDEAASSTPAAESGEAVAPAADESADQSVAENEAASADGASIASVDEASTPEIASGGIMKLAKSKVLQAKPMVARKAIMAKVMQDKNVLVVVAADAYTDEPQKADSADEIEGVIAKIAASEAFVNELKSIDVSATKQWVDYDDSELVDSLPAAITVELYANGEATGTTAELNAGNNWTCTFANLPLYNEDGRIAYTVVETEVPEGFANTSNKTSGVIATNEAGTKHASSTVLVNKKKPELEKYVNKTVHEFINLDDTFTYDVIAYVTSDADKIVITDELNAQLQFAPENGNVKVYDLGTANNHLTAAAGDDTPTGKATVTRTDSADDLNPVTDVTSLAKIEVSGKSLAVTIANDIAEINNATGEIVYNATDLNALRGHFIRVQFDAQLTAEAKEAVKAGTALEGVTVTEDAPVITAEDEFAGGHAGVPNKASYQIEVGNKGVYDNESNTVTVIPETPEIEKYVNQAVHKDITIDEVFTYDIIAYVTVDADTVTISDKLDSQLAFASTPADVKVVAYADANHLPVNNAAGQAITYESGVTPTVATAGEAVEAKVTIEGQDLSVEIADAKALRGQWVKVTFSAKVAEGLTINDLKSTAVSATATSERDIPNVGNAPVASDENHEGVPNTATYTIGVKNSAGVVVDKYGDTSNTVTVLVEETPVVPPENPDKPSTEVEISKQAVGGGPELEGATLTVIDKATGEVIERWVSGTETHKITLEPGEYILREETAPHGYLVAEEITFRVTEDGKCEVLVDGQWVDAAGKVVMYDAPEEQDTPPSVHPNTPTSTPSIPQRIMAKTGDAGAFIIAGLTVLLAASAGFGAHALRRRRQSRDDA